MNEKTYKQLEKLATDYERGGNIDALLDEVNFMERHGVADERGELALFVEDFARRNGVRMFYDNDSGEYFTF